MPTTKSSFSIIQEVASSIVPKASFDEGSSKDGVHPADRQSLGYPDSLLSSSSRVSDNPLLSPLYDKVEDESMGSHGDSVLVENSPSLTIFLLINTMIGSGILNQPFVFYQSGAMGGVLGYFLAASMTWLGLNILTAAGLKTQIYEYGALTKFTLGRKGEILIDVSIIIGCFGALLGYILVVGSTVSILLGSWGCNNDACGLYFTTMICVGLFVLPVCMLRHFGHLAILSIFSVFAIVCVLFLVIIGGPLMESGGDIVVFNGVGMVKSLGSIIFSLSCASANFQAFITTKKTARNRKSWMSVTAAVVFIGSAMCVAMGVAGYLAFKANTDGIILDNFTGHQFDFFKIMVAAHLIFYIPVNFIIMRYSIIKLAYNSKSEDLPYPKHAAITITLLVATTAFVLMLNAVGLASGDAFSLILDLTGGISGSITSFILPSWIFLAIGDKSDKLFLPAKMNLFLGVAVLISVIVTTVMNYT